MALFKIFKGSETAKLINPNATGYRVPTDGYAYYDTSTKLFYIDADYDGNGTIKRYPINAAGAWRLKNYNRLTDANIAHITDGGMELFQATATMTDNKPDGNGQILHFHWDTSSSWDSQLFIPDGHGGSMQWRAHTNATDWGDGWKTLLDSDNYTTYTVKKDGTGAFGTWGISITGNAASATYATNVRITETNPSSATTYYPNFTAGVAANTNYVLRGTKHYYLYDAGTAATGVYLNIGAANYKGGLTLHTNSSYYGDIAPTTLTANRTYTLPDASGTIALTSNLSAYVLKAGDTMTGNLTISKTSSPTLVLKNTTIDTTAASISAAQYNSLYFEDKNNYINAFVQGFQATDGHTEVHLAARRRNTANDNNVQNLLKLLIAANGTQTVSVSSPAAWRSAIAAVNKAGDTMTGDLTIQGGTSSNAARINLNRYDGSVTGFVGYSRDNTKYGLYIAGTSPVTGYLTYIDTSTGRVYYRDSYNTNSVSLAYSQSGLNYADYTYLAGWNGYELRAVAKTQFAQASHTHSYLPLSGGQMTGPLTWKDGNALPEFSGNPPFLLGIESFANGGTTKWKTTSSITVGGATKDGDGNTISSTYLKLSGGQMTGAIGFGATSMNRAILYYNSTYPKYGIWYNDASVDTMRFSASGNADTNAGADLCINGNGDGTVTIRGKTILHTGNYSTTCDTRYVKKAGDTMTGHLTAPSTACSWISGQNAANAAFNVGNATNTDSYWPWMRQTNTSSAKWFSFGTLGTSFYWIGSATSRTGNGYDYGMQFNVANGYLQGCSRVYGAVWNDYAEYRKDNPNENQEPGRCIKELGDGSLALTTKRLERGCEIVSDTFGFAIGQDEKNGYNTPIASNGRVLAYPYESIEEFRTHIGWPVCSGPNGTVSIMTEEEEEKYPSRIIGTISEIPTYEEWGTGKIKVDGRIWIRIR